MSLTKQLDLRERVEEVLDEIRPAIMMDGGNILLVDITDEGVVQVELVGACVGCPMSMLTLKAGVERTLRERIPEVTEVEAV